MARWKDVRPGHVVTIEGRVEALTFSCRGGAGDLEIGLSDLRVTGMSVK